jgi:hypothetical protein
MSNTNTTKTAEFLTIYRTLSPHSKHRAWRMVCKLTRKEQAAKAAKK